MDALTKAHRALLSRSEDKRLALVPGLADDLRAIGEAFAEVSRRTDLLAASVLRMRYGIHPHSAQDDALGSMGQSSGAVSRIARHGERCTCEFCMQGRL